MKYLVIADAHLGVTSPLKLVELRKLVNSKQCPAIWLGDTFDLSKQENAFNKYKDILRSHDVVISGNHDYGISSCRAFQVGEVFLTHGDLVDFGYGFQRLQQVAYGTTAGTPIESLLCKLRKWSLDDVYNMYQIIQGMSDRMIQLFDHHDFKFKASKLDLAKIAALGLFKLCLTPKSQPTFVNDILPMPDGEKVWGYATTDPTKLLTRVLAMYPEARQASTIVIGHTHTPCDELITINGKAYRFITLGAWIGDKPTTYLQIDNGILEVIRI